MIGAIDMIFVFETPWEWADTLVLRHRHLHNSIWREVCYKSMLTCG